MVQCLTSVLLSDKSTFTAVYIFEKKGSAESATAVCGSTVRSEDRVYQLQRVVLVICFTVSWQSFLCVSRNCFPCCFS